MDLKVVRYEVAERVATVTLARPERLNSWTGRMHATSAPLWPSRRRSSPRPRRDLTTPKA